MLIGSKAMKIHFPEFREPKDEDHLSALKISGVDNFWHISFPSHWQYGVASPDFLYTLKVSHAFWDIHGTWEKHMHDILFLQSKGAVFMPKVYDILLPVS